MSNLVLNATRVARHSRRYFLVLCAWCDTELGAVGTSHGVCACDSQQDLLREARRRVESLGEAADPDPVRGEGRRVGRRAGRRRVVRGRGPVAVG